MLILSPHLMSLPQTHTSLKYTYQELIKSKMNRKFNHQDIAMIGGFIAIVTVITINLLTSGI